MKLKHSLAGVAVLAGCLFSTTAFSLPFIQAPEANVPTWTVTSPYQRDIYWDFSSNPNGSSAAGAPGADYSGFLDNSLAPLDGVALTGDVSWMSTAPGNQFTSYSGIIGIDNRGGGSTLTGTATFHMAGIADRTVGRLWEELNYYSTTATGLTDSIVLPAGYSRVDHQELNASLIGNNPNLGFVNVYHEIRPSASWEDRVFTFSVDAGEYAFIDMYHVAAEAIPTPAPLALMGLGLAAIGFRSKSRKR